MGLIGKLASAAGKSVARNAFDIASGAAAIAASNIRKEKSEERIQSLLQDEEFPNKFVIKQRAYTTRDTFNVYDEAENVIYIVKGSLFSTSPILRVYDANENEVGSVKKKILSFRSPFDRFQGENVDFEICAYGNCLGRLRNKKLGDRFDGFDKRLKEVKDGFAGLRFEYDFVDWEILNKLGSFGYEISTKDGVLLAKIDRNMWNYEDCYVVSHLSKENEILYLIMMLAMISLDDDRTRREKIADSFRYGFNDD